MRASSVGRTGRGEPVFDQRKRFQAIEIASLLQAVHGARAFAQWDVCVVGD